ncbi:MAG: hypothetical protein AAGA24_03300 [Pseudomonadota bacterium]
MSRAGNIIDKGLAAALKLAELTPWDELTLHAIVAEAKLNLADFHGVADKADLSAGVEGYFDKAMSAGPLDTDESARTRLFDVLMMRFEAMEDARDGVMSYFRWRDRTLPGLQIRVRGRLETARWALACAGLDAQDGVSRAAMIAGLSWAILQAERAWRQETSPDLTRTMAALDGELVKMEERAATLRRRAQRRKDGSDED